MPNDCPLRNNGESGGTCNVLDDGRACEAHDDAWPKTCPVVRMKEEV